MREIKFRVWNEEFKLFDTLLKDDYYGDGNIGFVDCFVGNEEDIWEQFTGLHDKNGREIYEGDVVKVYGFSKVTVGKVIYEDYYFTLDGFCDTGTDRPEMAFSEGEFEVNYEVIGNIHENPELLEVVDGK